MSGLTNVMVSAFVPDDCGYRIDAPSEYTRPDGTVGVTGWILQIGDGPDTVTLHFPSKAALTGLGAAILAKTGEVT